MSCFVRRTAVPLQYHRFVARPWQLIVCGAPPTALYLSAMRVGATALRRLAVHALGPDSAIRELYLGRNNLGLEGAQIVADAIRAGHRFRRLYFSHNDIGDKGVGLLTDALMMAGSSHLEMLDLADNRISDAGPCVCAPWRFDDVMSRVRCCIQVLRCWLGC